MPGDERGMCGADLTDGMFCNAGPTDIGKVFYSSKPQYDCAILFGTHLPTNDTKDTTPTLSIRPIIIRAIIPQLPAPTADITNLLPRTRQTTAILSSNTALGLEQIIRLHQTTIAQHTLRDIVPKRRVQRACGGPGAIDIIRGAGGVFVLPYRCVPGERFRHIGEVGLNVHDLEGVRVDGVELVPCIEARERGDGRADEGHSQRLAVVDGGGFAQRAIEAGGEVIVEDLELVLVGVAEEDARDGVRRVAADDAVEERGRVGEVVGAVVAREHVADDPSALVPCFARVELGDEEAEDAGLVRVGEVEEVEDVAGVPEVGVEGDDA